MRFAHPLWLFFVWLVPLVGALYGLGHLRRSRILGRYATPRALHAITTARQAGRRWARAGLLSVSLLLLALAVSGPLYGYRWREVERKGIDLIVALDCSRSMLAQDIQPDRLERAKREVYDLLGRLRGDRVGLVAFAGTAFLQCPLTLDYSGFHIFLQALSPGFLPVGGTALGDALDTARQAFDAKSPAEKAVLLITDGEQTRGDVEKAAERARDAGIRVFVIGVGSESGAPIPRKGGGFVKNSSGSIVLSRLDEGQLRRIATLTGGAYTRSVTGDMDLDTLYDKEIRGRMEARTLESGKVKVWEDRYQWPLVLAVAALFAALALPLRRRVPPVLLAAALTLGALPPNARAGGAPGLVHEGLEAYRQKDYDTALDRFLKAQVDDPEAPELAYDVGNAYYRKGDYQQALSSYGAGLSKAPAELKARLLYNMGNAAYRLGHLEEAVKHYKAALAAEPKDEDGKLNLEFVKRELKKKQEKQRGDSKKGDQKPQEEKGSDRAQASSGPDRKPPEKKAGSNGSGAKENPPSAPEKQEASSAPGAPQAPEKSHAGEPRSGAADQTAAGELQKPGQEGQPDRSRATSVLNRLQDQPGRALMPSYGERRVERDW